MTRLTRPLLGGKKNKHGLKPWLSDVQNPAFAVASSLFREIGTPVCQSLSKFLEAKDFDGLVNVCISPHDYDDWMAFHLDYCAVNLLSKADFLPTTFDREQRAISGFLEGEKLCKETNERLKTLPSESTRLGTILYVAKRKIASCVARGDFSDENLFANSGFGPGSSVGIPKRSGDGYYKFGWKHPSVTPAAFIIARDAICDSSAWSTARSFDGNPGHLLLVPGDEVSTVPKNAKIDRVIATQPALNMYLQKGVGRILRGCLKRVGVDLDYGQSRNRDLARVGSLDGSLATLDLKAASDCISIKLVEQLLPPDLFSLMCNLRTEQGVLPSGDRLVYEKFSSMGNGFTFELESLIFWALCSAVMSVSSEADRRLAVYGDDLIVPTSSAQECIDTLLFCGFTTNTEKSFTSGPFRESCGGHYFNGVDVTPLYIRKDIQTPASLIVLANGLRRCAFRAAGSLYGCHHAFRESYRLAVMALPKQLRSPQVPVFWDLGEFPDVNLAGDFDEVSPPFDRNIQGTVVEGYACSRKTATVDGPPLLAKALHGLMLARGVRSRYGVNYPVSDVDFGSVLHFLVTQGIPVEGCSGAAGEIALRDQQKLVPVKIPVHQWRACGPWLTKL